MEFVGWMDGGGNYTGGQRGGIHVMSLHGGGSQVWEVLDAPYIARNEESYIKQLPLLSTWCFVFFSSYSTTNKQSPIRDHLRSPRPRPTNLRPYLQPATCQSSPCNCLYIAILPTFSVHSHAYTPPPIYLYTSIIQHQYTSAKPHPRQHSSECLL